MKLAQLLGNRDGLSREFGSRVLTKGVWAESLLRFVREQSSTALLVVAFQLLVVFLIGIGATDSAFGQNLDTQTQLYFFTNDGCAPCRQVEPEIESLKQSGYPVTVVHVAQSPDWAETFSVDRTPTVILVSNQRIVGRHAGLIKAATLKEWFAAVGSGPRVNQSVETRVPAASQSNLRGKGKPTRGEGLMVATVSELPDSDSDLMGTKSKIKPENYKAHGTVHAGTTKPDNAIEARAMNATVRLKVKDAEGISYATGTVIHSHAGEWLVMTCGHTFREAGFDGKITAEFNFLDGPIQIAEGELISYDSESKDVALVAVHAGQDIQPVKLADLSFPVDRGMSVFSIGCDGGAEPTIRHTEIKNKAVYAPGDASKIENRQPPAQGAIKYDIYGRPAIGRSGGGLFNGAGELIGVCNAAAVESDEGIYSALDSLYWQIAVAKLDHLFDGSASESIAGSEKQDRFASLDSRPSTGMQDVVKLPSSAERGAADHLGQEHELFGEDTEVIIIVRSKTAPELGESITINNPTPQLIEYLGEMKRGAESRQVDIARLRKREE